jgi:hypothetical protein
MRDRSERIGYRILVGNSARTLIMFWSDAAKGSGEMGEMVAFITGGGSGIGEAAAKLLARRGARVALAGRTSDQLAEVAEAIGDAGGTAITVTCDVSDEDSVRSAIATTLETWGTTRCRCGQCRRQWHLGRDGRSCRGGFPFHPRYRPGCHLHHHQVRGSASQASRRLGDRHVLG